jgi:hypothetical protein
MTTRETATATTTVEGFSTSNQVLELPPQSLNGSSTAPQDDPNRMTKQDQPNKQLDDEAINTRNTTNADLTPKTILGSLNNLTDYNTDWTKPCRLEEFLVPPKGGMVRGATDDGFISRSFRWH